MNAASVLGIGLVFTLKDEVSNAASAMTQKFKQLDYVSSETAAKMESSLKGIGSGFKLMGAGAAILTPFAVAVNTAAKFEEQMSSVKAATASSANQMVDIKEVIMKAGQETKFSALEAAQGYEELAKAGVKANLIMTGGLTSALNLATAGNISVADSAILAGGAINAFSKETLNVTIVADTLVGGANSAATSVAQLGQALTQSGGIASAAGLGFNDTISALSVMANNFLVGGDAGTSFKTMLASLQPQTKAAQAEFEKLKLTINGQNQFFKDGKIKGIDQIAQQLQDAVKGKTEEQSSEIFRRLFGSDGVRAALALAKEGAQGIEKMKAQMATFTAAKVAEEKLNNFNGAVTILKSNLETFMIKIGSNFLPILKSFAERVTSVVQSLAAFSDTGFGQFVIKLAASIGVGLVALGGFVSAFHTVKFAMMAIQPVLVMLKGAFASTLVPLLPYIAVGVAVAGAIYGMIKAYQSFTDVLNGNAAPANGFLGFMQKIGGAIHAVIAIWKSATNEGFTLSGKLYEALNSIGLGEFALNIGTWIVRIKAFFGGAVERFENLKNVFGSVWEAFGRIGTAFSPIIDLLAKAGFTIDKLGGDVSIFSQLGGYAFDALTLGIRGIAVALEITANYVTLALEGFMIFYNFVTNTFNEINAHITDFKEGFISLPELFGKIGMAITRNLLEGIQAGWSSITSFLVNSLKALPGGEAVASYFGIGGDTAEGQAKQAAVNQTGLAGSGVSDTEIAPSQASSSFSKKVDNINNASVTKAQQTRETSVAMKELSSAGIANTGQQNTQVNLQPKFNVQIGDRDVAAVIREINELDDARS
ncbi:phage tail tape measure protein [Bernardetia sp. Wsw4-3y2]|uniref:phage tail tape measure protein n=1 Tax=Bernardetia sp. Wsw4-3y2 TaxID=3127471 RepID=UPI0030CE3102